MRRKAAVLLLAMPMAATLSIGVRNDAHAGAATARFQAGSVGSDDAIQVQTAPPETPDTPAAPGARNGVIRPPAETGSTPVIRPPATDRMPVVPPTGTPGNRPDVVPK